MPVVRASATACAGRLKLMAFDVDGVLTDGSRFYTDDGVEIKAFNTLDGHGLKMLQQAGVTVAIITGRRARCVELRARNLGIGYLFQGVDNKLAVMNSLLVELGLTADVAGYMGDDLPDLPALGVVGLPACPADAADEVKKAAIYISPLKGGEACVREVIEKVLRMNGHWEYRVDVASR